MKRVLFFIVMIQLSILAKGKSTSPSQDTAKIYTEVDVNPKFPGGLKAFDSYVDVNSAKILKGDHTSGIVIAAVLIERNGKITKPFIVKSLTPATDSAAIYLLNNSPLWKPATINGMPVRTGISIAVRFSGAKYLHGEDGTNDKEIKPHYVDIAIDEPSSTTPVDDSKIFTVVETAPTFVGGYAQFNEYLKQNLRWPPDVEKVGSRVILTFVVEKDGSLDDIHITRGVTPELNAEAIRLIKNCPKWTPGMQRGRPVRVAYSVPVVFDAGN